MAWELPWPPALIETLTAHLLFPNHFIAEFHNKVQIEYAQRKNWESHALTSVDPPTIKVRLTSLWGGRRIFIQAGLTPTDAERPRRLPDNPEGPQTDS